MRNNRTLEVTTYSNFRHHLKKFLDEVFISHTPLYVKGTKGEDVVVLLKSDYESMEETLYLLSSEKNRTELMKGVKESENGETTTMNIDDLWK
jgi:antitoxin YefM